MFDERRSKALANEFFRGAACAVVELELVVVFEHVSLLLLFVFDVVAADDDSMAFMFSTSSLDGD